MPKEVEQVTKDGDIVTDYDQTLSPRKIYAKLEEHFPELTKDSDGFIHGVYKNCEYSIRIKNITYLGNPHPHYKKRIQISNDLQDFYKESMSRNMTPLLMGIYTYNENTLFCIFNIEDFINKKAHNSSAHVYTDDMVMAVEESVFQKIDYFGNKITVFRPDVVEAILEDLLIPEGYSDDLTIAADVIKEQIGWGDDSSLLDDATREEESKILFVQESRSEQMDVSSVSRLSRYGESILSNDIKDAIEDFFHKVNKTWNGIDCYEEMIEDNYRNKYQPEWAGFYLEYAFEKYLNDNNLGHLIAYAQDKTKGGIDLDLYFPTIESYGDLKAHSEDSRAIQGNDWATVMEIIDNPEEQGHIFYIVCEHSTEKDSLHNYEVTKFWNKAQNKEKLMSYSTRMKNNVVIKKVYILDINSENKPYLTQFKQGVNSNGKLREPKIMIENSNLEHFIISEINL